MKFKVLKDILMFILIVFLSIILIKFLIEKIKMDQINEVKISELSLCQSDYKLQLFHPIDIENNVPIFYEITLHDSIISKKKFLETVKSNQIDSTDFSIACSDSLLFLIYSKENDTLLRINYSDFISK